MFKHYHNDFYPPLLRVLALLFFKILDYVIQEFWIR
jgi:hypothetical protein